MNNVEDWLKFYENLHPLGIDMGLTRIKEVWQRLNIPAITKQKVITVAGTNGKGSACQMMQLLLANKGLKIGCYTSPHLFKFNERISIDSVQISDNALISTFEIIESVRGDVTLTHFEATTLAALIYFAEQQVDIAVLEVGLGGRLDAINIIDADAAIIMSIGLDHESYLGSDLKQIAVEKAGVFRPHKPAVFAGNRHSESAIEYCNSNQIPLIVNHQDYVIDYEAYNFTYINQRYQLPTAIKQLGKHQIDNAAGVSVLLLTLGLINTDDLQKLAKFQLAGRLQKINSKPDVIIDVAHNIDAAAALAQHITKIKRNYASTTAIIAMLKDKDHKAILQIAADTFDQLIFTSTTGERGFSAEQLAEVYQQLNHQTPHKTFQTAKAAYQQTLQTSGEKDLLVVFGTFTIMADICVV